MTTKDILQILIKGQDAFAKRLDAVVKGQDAFARGQDAFANRQDAFAEGLDALIKRQDTFARGQDALVMGQNALKEELAILREETRVGFKRTHERLDKQGMQLAYLEDDAPTREEYDELTKRVKKIEKVVSA